MLGQARPIELVARPAPACLATSVFWPGLWAAWPVHRCSVYPSPCCPAPVFGCFHYESPGYMACQSLHQG